MKVYYSCAVDNQDISTIKKEIATISMHVEKLNGTLVSNFDYNISDYNEIVKLNLLQILECDVLICNLSNSSHHYVGCIGELVYAKIFKKTTYVITGASAYKDRAWIKYHADKEFYDIDELIIYLKKNSI